MTPNQYTKEVKIGGEIESKYLAMGSYKVKSIKKEGSELTKKYYIYYPEEVKETNKNYPVVVILNGTGVLPKKYKALFKHLASWGFVVIGNDDGSTGFGTSSDETIDFIISENSNKDSIFDVYKTAVALSPTHEETAHAFGWNYDLTKITIPVLMLAGTEGDFETQSVIPLEKMKEMYNKIGSTKVMMRRIGAEHGQMLYSADGYVTAWFMWQLQGDEEASKAFIGDNPEINSNTLYQDIKISVNN